MEIYSHVRRISLKSRVAKKKNAKIADTKLGSKLKLNLKCDIIPGNSVGIGILTIYSKVSLKSRISHTKNAKVASKSNTVPNVPGLRHQLKYSKHNFKIPRAISGLGFTREPAHFYSTSPMKPFRRKWIPGLQPLWGMRAYAREVRRNHNPALQFVGPVLISADTSSFTGRRQSNCIETFSANQEVMECIRMQN